MSKDLVGMRFGRLVVLRKAPDDARIKYSWECVCDCGVVKAITTHNLQREGGTQSCGCLRREALLRGRKNGISKLPEYPIWNAMMARCFNERNYCFKDYGGRGITVCKEWFDIKQFVADMGPKPSKDHHLDRIDNDKGYSKENCRWATRVQNMRNRRSNALVVFNGKEVAVAEAAEKSGINPNTIWHRRKRGLTQETGLFRAVEQPPHSNVA